jgi:hypothetical protein
VEHVSEDDLEGDASADARVIKAGNAKRRLAKKEARQAKVGPSSAMEPAYSKDDIDSPAPDLAFLHADIFMTSHTEANKFTWADGEVHCVLLYTFVYNCVLFLDGSQVCAREEARPVLLFRPR